MVLGSLEVVKIKQQDAKKLLLAPNVLAEGFDVSRHLPLIKWHRQGDTKGALGTVVLHISCACAAALYTSHHANCLEIF